MFFAPITFVNNKISLLPQRRYPVPQPNMCHLSDAIQYLDLTLVIVIVTPSCETTCDRSANC